jgi:thioredoxin-related protein
LIKILELRGKLLFLFFIAASVIGAGSNLFAQLTFEEALVKAKAENKKVIVDIYTDWCGWCVKMDKDVYGNAEIKKIVDEKFIFVKLDAESKNKHSYSGKQYTEEELAAGFEATGYPTTVFLEPDGKLIEFNYDKSRMKNIPGYFKAGEFKKILEFIRDEKYKDTDLSTVL